MRAHSPKPFVLAAGSCRAIARARPGGQDFTVTLALTRERLQELRDACDDLLDDGIVDEE
jgi:hypothetical protein